MIKIIFQIACAIVIINLSQKGLTYSYGLYQKGKASETWVDVKAKVEKFEYRRSSSSGSRGPHGYRTGGQPSNPHYDVLYHYTYEGVEYSGDITGFGPYSKGELKRPRGGRATIYVNPDNPAESVYVKGVSKPNLGFMAFLIAMGLFGLILSLLALKNIWRYFRN